MRSLVGWAWETYGKTFEYCAKPAKKRGIIPKHEQCQFVHPRPTHTLTHTEIDVLSTYRRSVLESLYTLSTQSIKTIRIYKERDA